MNNEQKDVVLYNNKEFSKSWTGLENWLREKARCLTVETNEWRKNAKTDNDSVSNDRIEKANFQEAKIVFICGLLSEFFGDNKTAAEIYKLKNWILSPDGNHILRIEQ